MTNGSGVTKYVRVRDDLAEMPMDDGLVILDKSNEKVHQLNSMAREVWDLTIQGAGPAEIADHIVSRYEVPYETAMHDVQGVLNDFLKLNLLKLECAE